MSIEMGLKMVFKDYKKLKDGFIGEGAKKGYEIQYTGTHDGERSHARQRVYAGNGRMIVITARTSQNEWSHYEETIGTLLYAIKLEQAKTTPDTTSATPPKLSPTDEQIRENEVRKLAPNSVRNAERKWPDDAPRSDETIKLKHAATEIKGERHDGPATIDSIIKDLNIERQTEEKK